MFEVDDDYDEAQDADYRPPKTKKRRLSGSDTEMPEVVFDSDGMEVVGSDDDRNLAVCRPTMHLGFGSAPAQAVTPGSSTQYKEAEDQRVGAQRNRASSGKDEKQERQRQDRQDQTDDPQAAQALRGCKARSDQSEVEGSFQSMSCFISSKANTDRLTGHHDNRS